MAGARARIGTAGAADELWVCHLGLLGYAEALAIQHRLRARRQEGELPDMLLLLEHTPVYTRGRRASAEELPFGESFYRARGAEVHTTDRGGRVTYHGPGQLVGYPIMAVADVQTHLRTIEAAIVEALAGAGVAARSRHDEGIDYTGVWVQERKIASIGVHVARGVSTHGFAVNVENSLEPFSWVVACGLPGVTMTSLAAETGAAGERLPCFRKRMAYAFSRAHGRRQRLVSPGRLGIATPHAAGLAAERAPFSVSRPSAPEAVPA
ncbi:MAG TPA: lipoyl(octanoyl) transferase LipB [Solirubrobacteraceae bacterium]|jgi:lipoyl(octanoyl) transferase